MSPSEPETVDRLLTLPEVGGLLQVSVATLRKWQSRGRIKVVRLPSGTIRVHPSEVDRIINGDARPVSASGGAE